MIHDSSIFLESCMGNDKPGLLRSLRDGLQKTRERFVRRLDQLLLGKAQLDAETLEELEEILFTADLGVQTTSRVVEAVRSKARRGELEQPEMLRKYVKEAILEILTPRESPLQIQGDRPFVIMVIGVNGVGKTTTIAKIGKQWKDQGLKVCFVAADTFRAAAIEQLEIWGRRTGVEVVRQQRGADPSAVVFDALQAAGTRGTDLVILDTAGRLHTKVNLMDELKKIKRVSGRVLPAAPMEVLLVLDAGIGQNALSQARMFHDAVGVNGIAMTKLDGTAKGGVLVAVAAEFDIPIRYIGVGESIVDLQTFSAGRYVDALFGESSES
jgi:fused signal recognition particle receptor